MSIERNGGPNAMRVAVDPVAFSDPHASGEGPLELMVSGLEDLTPRIRRFELRSPQGEELPPWTPGAHLAVPVPIAGGGQIRCYSLAGDCAVRDRYEIAVLRHDEGSGGSRAIHHGYSKGLRLRCAYPRNDFELAPHADHQVLIAGGIGITPIRAMAIALSRRGTSFELHYAARSPRETAFLIDLAERFGRKVRFWHSEGPHPNRFDVAGVLRGLSRRAMLYVCGPPRLIEAVTGAADRLGLPRANVHSELFAAPVSTAGERAFDVYLTRSQRTVHVAADQSILDAVLAAGIAAEFGCRAGQCGACAVTVLRGEVDHRDEVLSDDERTWEKRMCICVSRAKADDLALDL